MFEISPPWQKKPPLSIGIVGSYVAVNPIKSIIKNIIYGTPSIFFWEIKSLSENRSLLQVKFDIPIGVKIRFLLLYIFLTFLAGTSSPNNNGFNLKAAIILIILLLLLCYLGRLLLNYRHFIKNVISEIPPSLSTSVHMDSNLFDRYPHRLFIGYPLFLFCTALILSITLNDHLVLSRKWSLILFIFTPALLAIIAFGYKSLRGSLAYTQFVVLGTNIMIALAFVFILLFLPIAINADMQNIIDLDNNCRHEYGMSIIDAYRNMDSFVLAKLTKIYDWAMQCSIMLPFKTFAITFLANIIFHLAANNIRTYHGSSYDLRQLFFRQLKTSEQPLIISVFMKVIALILFIAMSSILWYSMYIAFSMIMCIIYPQGPYLHVYSSNLITGTNLIWGILTMGKEPELGYIFCPVLIFPSIVFFLRIALESLLHPLFTYIKYSRMPLVEDAISDRVQHIALHFQLINVTCVIDNNTNSFIPRARFIGFPGRNLIIFSHNSLKFLDHYPQYFKPIIAHELAHLKYDCKRIFFFSLISRLSLTGAGFLNIIINSVNMEDRADDEARKYLAANQMPCDLLYSAIKDIEDMESLACKGSILYDEHLSLSDMNTTKSPAIESKGSFADARIDETTVQPAKEPSTPESDDVTSEPIIANPVIVLQPIIQQEPVKPEAEPIPAEPEPVDSNEPSPPVVIASVPSEPNQTPEIAVVEPNYPVSESSESNWWIFPLCGGLIVLLGVLGAIMRIAQKSSKAWKDRIDKHMKALKTTDTATLLVRYKDRTWHLGQLRRLNKIYIGSGPKNTLRLFDKEIALQHALLYVKRGTLWLKNLSSKPIVINGYTLKSRHKTHLSLPSMINLSDTVMIKCELQKHQTIPAQNKEVVHA